MVHRRMERGKSTSQAMEGQKREARLSETLSLEEWDVDLDPGCLDL